METNVAFLFPGVGSHYYGMGKQFYNNFKIVKDTFEEASDYLSIDLKELCFDSLGDNKLDNLEYAKPAIVCLSVATYRLLMQEIGINAYYHMGYSLGEYSALCCAGALRFCDALKIVKHRAVIINEVSNLVEGTMAWVVNIDKNKVEDICEKANKKGTIIYISAYNSPQTVSIAGSETSIRIIAREIEDSGGIVIPIKMSGPFHSPIMREAANRLKDILVFIEFGNLNTDVIANRNALPYINEKNSFVDNLSLQLVQPIRWLDSVYYLLENEIQITIEIGPKTVLKYLVEANTKNIKSYSLDNMKDLWALKMNWS